MSTLQSIGNYLGYFGLTAWVLLFGGLWVAMWKLKHTGSRVIAAVLILGLFAAFPGRWAWDVKQRVDHYKTAEAMYNERCQNKAGYKIYKVVEDVEGIQLLKVRHRVNEADPMAPGAAFALEGPDDEYISEFLMYRYPSSGTSDGSYFVNSDKTDDAIPGFRYVDVIDEKDGKRVRVTGAEEVTGKKDINAVNVKRALEQDPNLDLNVYNWRLTRHPASDPAPRYAVTFEDHVIPEERAFGLASSTVKVIDTQTNEVLAEMLQYAWGPAWGSAYKCPGVGHGSSTSTRQFVDHVLVARGATLPPPAR